MKKRPIMAQTGWLVVLSFAAISVVIPAPAAIRTVAAKPKSSLAVEQDKPGTLKGKVQNEKGKPLADAEVTITDTRDRSVKTTRTNASGDYSFETQPDEY
ncbi:MAG: carboxypeptidase-like regulatory domain-containing protein, partial [Blastocatellia bacterium]